MAVSRIYPLECVPIDEAGDMVTGSLADRVAILGAYFSEEMKVHPTLAAGIDVVSAGVNWTLGALSIIVPASQITVPYYLHAVVIETCSKHAEYEMVLYQGDGDTEVARLRFAVSGGFFGNFFTMNGPLIPANARISAALACSTGGGAAATIGMSICYHEAV